MTVHVEILQVANCPNAEIAFRRALDATHGTRAVVTTTVVDGEDDAARRGLRGSPTILIDGDDPFNDPTTPTSCSCRVRPGFDPVPTVAEIQAEIPA